MGTIGDQLKTQKIQIKLKPVTKARLFAEIDGVTYLLAREVVYPQNRVIKLEHLISNGPEDLATFVKRSFGRMLGFIRTNVTGTYHKSV